MLGAPLGTWLRQGPALLRARPVSTSGACSWDFRGQIHVCGWKCSNASPRRTPRPSPALTRVAAAGLAAFARWGGLGGVSTQKPERDRGDRGERGGGGGWQRDRPRDGDWRGRAPPRSRPGELRPSSAPPPPPLWREEGEAASEGGGWGSDDEDGDAQDARPRAPPRGERRPGGWGSGGGGGGEAPARKWLTTRERREADPLRAGTPTLASTLRGEALYGVAPVRAALAAGRRTAAHVLFLQSSMDAARRKDAGAVDAIVAAATAAGATVRYVDKHELNLLSDNRPHQGVVLDTAALDMEPLSALPPWEGGAAGVAPPVWVALDEVSDPQNMGAVLRCALFLGAAGVVTCARNSAPLSPVVSKASAGAMELMPVHACSSMPAFLAACAANGWDVLGADAGAESDDVANAAVRRPTLLVLGSEGRGLRTNVRRECARFVCVPGAGELIGGDAAVDSLNVGVAAGVLLHALLGAARRGAAA